MKKPSVIQIALLVAALTPGCDSPPGGTTDLARGMDALPPQAVDDLLAMDGAPAVDRDGPPAPDALPFFWGVTWEQGGYSPPKAAKETGLSQSFIDRFWSQFSQQRIDGQEKQLLDKFIDGGGVNLIRVPFQWYTIIEHTANGWIPDTKAVANLRADVEPFTRRGIHVIVCPHNYMKAVRYSGWPSWQSGDSSTDRRYIGGSQKSYPGDPRACMTPQQHYQAWRTLVRRFGDNPRVIWVMSNEPNWHDMDVLMAHAQDFVDGIRDGGHTGHYGFMADHWGHFDRLKQMWPYVRPSNRQPTAAGKPLQLRELKNGRFIPMGHFYGTTNKGGAGKYCPPRYTDFEKDLVEIEKTYGAAGMPPLIDEIGLFTPELVDEAQTLQKRSLGWPQQKIDDSVRANTRLFFAALEQRKLRGLCPWRSVFKNKNVGWSFRLHDNDLRLGDPGDWGGTSWLWNAREHTSRALADAKKQGGR